MGRAGKELAPLVIPNASGANETPVMPVITALQPITNEKITTVIIDTGQLEVSKLLANIRPEWNNLEKGNGARQTILKRLNQKFQLLNGLIETHTPERLGTATMEAIKKENDRYQLVLKAEKMKVA